MKKIILALLSCTFLIGCSSDSDSSSIPTPETPSSSNGTKLKRIEELQNGSIIKTIDYQYNALGNITKMIVNDQSKIYETTFNYDSNNKMVTWNLKEYYISMPLWKTEQTNTLEYEDGKITNICIDRINSYPSSSPTYSADRILYSYDSGVYPSSITHYSDHQYVDDEAHDCTNVIYEDNEEVFEYVNGNATYYSSGSSGFSNNYNVVEYDAKINPLASIKPDAFKNSIGRSSVNNMTKVMVHDADDDSLEGTAVFENSYNESNFLMKAIEKYYPAGSSTATVTTTMNYYYY